MRYSKIVIDEIQSYSPYIIAKLLCGLKLISIASGRFALITATLPPFITEEMHKLKIKFNEPQRFTIDDKLRHKISILETDDFDFEKILEDAKRKKVLIICNTVKRACEIYSHICKKTEYVRLLHSNYILKHRRILETGIINFVNNADSTGIWISTQIVEASLDIDFDVLYTDMSSADSLLQRMGRCYRKRNYSTFSNRNI